MTFYNYVKRAYKNADSPEGGFARDMISDDTFPMDSGRKHMSWYEIIENHLLAMGACDECMDAFNNCWKEYISKYGGKRAKGRFT